VTIRIITDSTCDLGLGGVVAYDIDIVPLIVTFGAKSYRDGIDLTNEEFYELLATSDELPTTSQPSPSVFQEVFQRRLDEGHEIIGIFIAEKLSGTYQSAMTAKDSLPEDLRSRVHLIDSRQVSGGLAILVLEACAMRDRGCGTEEICEALSAIAPRIRLYTALDTLRYLRMGGRLSTAAAIAGGILNVVPVVSLVDGEIKALDKIRKKKKAFSIWLRERLNTTFPDPRYPVVYIHSNNISGIEPIQEEFKYLIVSERLIRVPVGTVVGTHAGPGAVGIVFVVKEP